MTLRKRLLKSTPVIWLASWLFSLWLRFVFLTSRIEYHWPVDTMPYARGRQPALFCFWHGRMVLHPFVKPPRPHYVLISRHGDGRMISMVIRRFGVDTVHGSRGKGVRKALAELKRVADRRGNISITPDGPRGPHQQAADGAAYVAMKTGYPVIVTSFASTRARRFERSWDRFLLPKPFGRIVFVAGSPLRFADSEAPEDLAAATAQIEAELNRVTEKSDRLCGLGA
jgi:lysophospholipid acyltransferase (LPLAT)-like uncharacterized protein